MRALETREENAHAVQAFRGRLEECARREVEEETLEKASSAVEHAGGEITVDHKELDQAAWFRRDSLPPTFSAKSLAGWMMDKFGKN